MSCLATPNLNLLVKRVDRTIAQCRRFEEMAHLVSPWMVRWPTPDLASWLNDEALPLYERELALVALVFKGDALASAVIDDYELVAGEVGGDHHLFCQVIKIEWQRRHCQRRAA